MDNLDTLLNELKDSVANTTLPSYRQNLKSRHNQFDNINSLSQSYHGSYNNNNNDNINILNSSYSSNNSSPNQNSNDYHNISKQQIQSSHSRNNYNNNSNNNHTMTTNNNNNNRNNNTSTLSSNLSELDCLLEELSSASFTGEVNRRSSGLSSQHSTLSKQQRQQQQCVYDFVPSDHSGQSNELEDLMSSLSCLNTEEKSAANQYDMTQPLSLAELEEGDLNAYDNVARPPQHHHKGGGDDDDNLNSMMASLSSNLTSQGVEVTNSGCCAACGKMIMGQVITALGRLWHPEHFACVKCKVEIGGGTFFERDSQPYCEQDYHLLFSPKCAHCHQAILDRCVTALDKTWHMEHFACYTCGKSLADEAFHEKEGRVFCQFDFLQHFAPRCAMCTEAICEDFLTALNQQWHPQCFVCFECHTALGTCSFFEHEGMPYCKQHYHARKGSLCAHCNQPISGRCITAMSQKFHPDHFKCTYCQKALTKGTFKEEGKKPYCHRCFVTLFS